MGRGREQQEHPKKSRTVGAMSMVWTSADRRSRGMPSAEGETGCLGSCTQNGM